MKTMLVECFYEYCPEHFNADAEVALGFTSTSLQKPRMVPAISTRRYGQHRNMLPHQQKTVEPGSFAGFFGATLDEVS